MRKSPFKTTLSDYERGYIDAMMDDLKASAKKKKIIKKLLFRIEVEVEKL